MSEEQTASFLPVQSDVASGGETQYRFSEGDIFLREGKKPIYLFVLVSSILRIPSSPNIVFSMIDQVNYLYVLSR